jgi:hypothetical protein
VAEIHPEASFAAIDPSSVVASTKTAEGRAARVAALESAGRGPTAASCWSACTSSSPASGVHGRVVETSFAP